MNYLSTVNRLRWIMLTTVALMACNNPTVCNFASTISDKSSTSDTAQTDPLNFTPSSMTMSTHLGRVWCNEKGEVIGVIFSNTQGDYCESREKTISVSVMTAALQKRMMGKINQ